MNWRLLGLLICAALAPAQTTNGLISGRVVNETTQAPITAASIEYEQLATHTLGHSISGKDGYYSVPLLPPGAYRIRVSSPDYQAREIYNVNISVAGYASINFALRPLQDVWERGRYRTAVFSDNSVLPFYGPDFDPAYVGSFAPQRLTLGQLEPSISNVIDPRAIDSLPLAGRDIYATLVLQPGVAADSATNRSLGLSANGQQPTSSNFLLDGMELNNSLLSGPALRLAPEMVQEYRISTNNFSAEYGRTAGYIANAVTRSASADWHGIAYGDLTSSVLNANTFQNNANGLSRNSLHQIQSGFSAGGAIPHTRLLIWSALDYFGSRSFSNPTQYFLPTETFANSLPQASRGAQLLRQYPPVEWASPIYNSAGFGPVNLTPPVTLKRITGLARADYALTAKQRLMARFAANSLDRPDFNWSPYSQAALKTGSAGTALLLTSLWSANAVSEIRAGFHRDTEHWNLALANLPSIDGAGATLPGNCCLTNNIQEGYHNSTGTAEVAGNFLLTLGPHLLTMGAGLLDVRPRSGFAVPPIASFDFDSLSSFAQDQPFQFDTLLSRTNLGTVQQLPNSERLYRYDQVYFFAQEDWRVSPRITLNAGLRYDRFNAPVNSGSVPDVLVVPGAGATFNDQIASATVATHTGSLYSAQPDNLALRLGVSLVILPNLGTVLRAGYGTFYDRPPDNFWETAAVNDFESASFQNSRLTPCAISTYYIGGNYSSLPQNCNSLGGSFNLFDLTLFQTRLKAPRVESFFLSLQQPVFRNVFVELNGTGSRGRNLLSTDILNRFNRAVSFFPPANGLPNIDYRANQGFSDYAAFSATIRYRTSRASANLSYTWSHSIDNQSDPLRGEYFDLGFSNQTDRTNQYYLGSFSFPGDTRSDRGNSDFDQRQSLAGWASVLLPSPKTGALKALLRNWSVATIFDVRSGLPYSVYAGEINCSFVCDTRANLLNSSPVYSNVAVTGGVQVLSPLKFSIPTNNQQGNTGRNEFVGPGFANIDVSIARHFSIRALGEQGRLTIRTDWFNVLNHANLQSPEAYLGVIPGLVPSQFGISLYGNTAQNNGFPVLTPLIPDARQIHFLARLEF